MKRILVGSLLMVALASTVLAQEPQSQVLPSMPMGNTPQAAGPATMLPPSEAQAVVGAGCAPACYAQMKTVCVPDCKTKRIETPVYSKVCEPFCVPSCSLFHCFGGCAAGQCEHPRTKYYLVKRICVEERTIPHCTPACVPVCAAGPGCGQAPACYAPPSAAGHTTLPVPAPK